MVLDEYLQKAEVLSKSRAFDEAKKNYEKAVERCDEFLKTAPGNDYLHYRKVRVLFELRRYEGPDWAQYGPIVRVLNNIAGKRDSEKI